jgi:hypothetical protein
MTKTELIINQEQKTENKRVQLVFPKSKGTEIYLPKDLSKYTGRDFYQLYCADLSEVAKWFEEFTTESIELSINSIIQTEYETKLIIGRWIKSRLKTKNKPWW